MRSTSRRDWCNAAATGTGYSFDVDIHRLWRDGAYFVLTKISGPVAKRIC